MAGLQGIRRIPYKPAERSAGPHQRGSSAMASEHGVEIFNETEFDNETVMKSLRDQHPEVASMIRWGESTKRPTSTGIFERDKFVTPTNIFHQMKMAQDAVEIDDVCGGVLESSEALAFNDMAMECWDSDEQDVWNQIADDIDLDSRIREMWREMFTVSQFYAFSWWGQKSYKVRGKTKAGTKRKRTFENLHVPLGISLIDPLRVVPVGNLLFNQDKLAYIATPEDSESIDATLRGTVTDDTISGMFSGKYTSEGDERQKLVNMGVTVDHLWLLNEDLVWRHTETRSQYKRFADVRMKSVFDLLDLKTQLKEMDRAHLIGGTNFIVLVKKGSKDRPATQPEIDNLQANMRVMARVPVLVGDDRLSIEIITPDNDRTLEPERYDSLNGQITARLFQMFMAGRSGGRDDSLKMARVVARGLESRRAQLQRQLMRKVFLPIFRANEESFKIEPTLSFYPRQISLAFDPGLAAYYMDLLDRRHISRQTALSQVDIFEEDESRKKQREKEEYDGDFDSLTPILDPELQAELQMKVAKQAQDAAADAADKQAKLAVKIATTAKPVADEPSGATTAPGGGGKEDPKAAGRTKGGNRSGGGAAPGSGQGEEKDPRRKAKG